MHNLGSLLFAYAASKQLISKITESTLLRNCIFAFQIQELHQFKLRYFADFTSSQDFNRGRHFLCKKLLKKIAHNYCRLQQTSQQHPPIIDKMNNL